ncbi:tumor necrosis factor receptor superfamily member 12A [Vipera latastei]
MYRNTHTLLMGWITSSILLQALAVADGNNKFLKAQESKDGTRSLAARPPIPDCGGVPSREPSRAEASRGEFSALSQSEAGGQSVARDRTSSAAAKEQRDPPAMLAWGVILGLLPVLLGSGWGEPIAETSCPGDQSWSPDLEKCMDCSVCQHQNKNDFCSTCGDPQPTNGLNLWVLVGASLGAVFLASIIAGTIIYARCRRREKFTTPIEETGGHSAQESLIH